MGLWSKIKKAAKKVWRAVKATVRVVVRVIVAVVFRIINLALVWLPIKKKLRVQVLILRKANEDPVVEVADMDLALDYVKKTLNDKFDVTLKFYGKPGVQILPNIAPAAALSVECDSGAAKNEWGEAGEYFADNLAGWNAIPLSFRFPITAYIVKDIAGKIGCSMGLFTDYVTVSEAGVKSDSTLMHEIGHCCNLLHRDNQKNLMFPNDGRGNDVTGWQKFVFRNSRHCTFW
ncbi:MAG: hypothetical protein KDC34_19580 [Saprospiraceae bacterium]|nr:hypothetical protein [Saprospiraceae bacterium]